MLPLCMRLGHVLCISFLLSTTCAQGQIAQFLNYECTDKSLVNPTVSLPQNTCLVTSGALGVVVQLLPACVNATLHATLQLYNDESCAIPSTDQMDDVNGCFNYENFNIPAVMFICGSVADGDSDATSTTTVSAGSVLVPVAKATGATATSNSDGLSSQTATDSSGLVASATPASSASNPSQTNAGSTGGGSGSGLSQHDQIILGVALPVGSIIVALMAWLCPKPWNK